MIHGGLTGSRRCQLTPLELDSFLHIQTNTKLEIDFQKD